MLVMQLLFAEMPECVAKVDANLTRDSQIVSLSSQAEYVLERRRLNFATSESYEDERQCEKKTTY